MPDVVAPGLAVLFCGINPGLYSAATGYHFAKPGNRFWPVLHRAGCTQRQLRPDEQEQLLTLGLGVTNIVARATARADELSVVELRQGAARLWVLPNPSGLNAHYQLPDLTAAFHTLHEAAAVSAPDSGDCAVRRHTSFPISRG